MRTSRSDSCSPRGRTSSTASCRDGRDPGPRRPAPRRSGSTRCGSPTSCCGARRRARAGLLGVRRHDRCRGGGDIADQSRHLDPVRPAPQSGHHGEGRGDARRGQRRQVRVRPRRRPCRPPGPCVRPSRGPRRGAVRGGAEIIVPLLRAGHADFEGTFHAARDLEQRPVGPRPGRIPIMLGAKGPRMLEVAARHADIWSWFAEERSDIAEFRPRLDAIVAVREASAGTPRRSGGLQGSSSSRRGHGVRGEGLRRADPRHGGRDRRNAPRFQAGGCTQVEVISGRRHPPPWRRWFRSWNSWTRAEAGRDCVDCPHACAADSPGPGSC